MARLFASKGHPLILVSRTEKRLEELAAKIRKDYQITVHYFEFDLSNQKKIKKLFHVLDNHDFLIGYLIHAAGEGYFSEFADTDWARNETIISTNVLAVTHLTHLILPQMVQNKKGYILVVTGTDCFSPSPMMSVFGATQSFLQSFASSLASEVKGLNIVVSSLVLSGVKSKFYKRAGIPYYPVKRKGNMGDLCEKAYKQLHLGRRTIFSGSGARWQSIINRFRHRHQVADSVYSKRMLNASEWT